MDASGNFSDEGSAAFKKRCDKAVLLVTADNDAKCRVYFDPDAGEAAAAAALNGTIPEMSEEYYEPATQRGGCYPYILYDAYLPDENGNRQESPELHALKEMAAEGKVAHLHSTGNWYDIAEQIADVLRDRLKITQPFLEDERHSLTHHQDQQVVKNGKPTNRLSNIMQDDRTRIAAERNDGIAARN